MSRPFIVVGDKTSHGGVVLTGSVESDVAGRPLARVGDKVSCPRHRNNAIATGDPACIIDGAPAARAGDKTLCGATLIPSQATTTD